MRIQLLGGFQLAGRTGGLLLPLPQAKRAALLAYLAIARPHGVHRRDTLLALFWPELDDAHARNSLNQALYYLRSLLGSDAIRTGGAEAVGLVPGVVGCDVVDFEALLDRDDSAAALEIYCGPLLDGFHVSGLVEVERWIEDERSRLRERAGRAALLLAERAAAAGSAERALDWSRRALSLGWDEPALRRVIALLDRLGDRAGALRVHRDFARELEAEYDARPSPETEALIAAVRARAEVLVAADAAPSAEAAAPERTRYDEAAADALSPERTQPDEAPADASSPAPGAAGPGEAAASRFVEVHGNTDGLEPPRRVSPASGLPGTPRSRRLALSAGLLLVVGIWAAWPGKDEGGDGSAAAASGLLVLPDTAAIPVGGTQRFSVPGAGGRDGVVSWSSSDPAVAAVDASGLVTGVVAGRATITAAAAGVGGSAAIVVELAVRPARLVAAYHTCVLSADGEAHCWGMNGAGQLGINRFDPPSCVFETSCVLRPEPVSSRSGYVALTSTWGTTCAIAADGVVRCWGAAALGEIGNGIHDGPHRCGGGYACALEPRGITGGLRFATLSGGGSHFCGLTREGRAYCWGNNGEWALGVAPDDSLSTCVVAQSPCSPAPVPVASELRFVALSAGWGFTCGVAEGGVAHCWGGNAYGQLGDGTTQRRRAPTPVAGGFHFTAVAAARGRHACGLTQDGRAYCWGRNTNGQLGDGSTGSRSIPVPVAGAARFVSLTGGEEHTCGLAADGAAHCWGKNAYGRLGDGTRVDRNSPVPVATSLRFSTLVAGNTHTCGLALDGRLYCWGENRFGALGDGTTASRPVPGVVPLDVALGPAN